MARNGIFQNALSLAQSHGKFLLLPVLRSVYIIRVQSLFSSSTSSHGSCSLPYQTLPGSFSVNCPSHPGPLCFPEAFREKPWTVDFSCPPCIHNFMGLVERGTHQVHTRKRCEKTRCPTHSQDCRKMAGEYRCPVQHAARLQNELCS